MSRDPALLERIADGQLRLRVFPVRRGQPATVTIVLATDAATVARVDRGTSLIAVPADPARFASDDEIDDPYADYWPAQEDARIAADW